jgi:hypothetical protein
MIIFSYSNIDIIQGNIGYGNAEGITDWRIENTSNGVFNISNSSIGIITPSGGTTEIGQITGSSDRYMIFKAGTSTFTVPAVGIICDVLIVGGGGGGGFDGSGGGGGGEVKYYTNNITSFKTGGAYTLSEGTYTINVGTGGAAGANINSAGSNGTISEIKNNLGTTLLSAGGGGGGGSKLTNGVSGVGGGGGAGMGGSYTGGASTGSGGIGGNSYSGSTGGGGAGGANVANKNGGNGQSTQGGSGGVGVDINIIGTSVGYGGGGAGGTWQPLTQVFGTQGGGNGGTERANPSIGTPNTGGGGGGGGNATYTSGSSGVGSGGAGGSGIVIIRYSTAKLTIIDNGNIGIGTIPITSSSLLEINGDVNISSNYRINNIDVLNDTSNYVLSTSNILVSRISTEIGNGSNYISRINTALNTRINDTSNYIATRNNSSGNNVNSQWISTSTGIYYNTPIKEPITIPSEIGTDIYMSFTYTTDTVANSGQTQYTITVPTGGITCDILIVGGGGGGAARHGGGGGAGAVIYLTNQILSAGTYTINVGNGGAGSQAISGQGAKGIDSSINLNSTNIYLAKGGGAGDNIIGTGIIKDGGSGGAGYGNGGNAVSTNIPTGIYGNSGGLQTVGGAESYYGGGGGGGALTIGANAVISGTITTGGNGGSGREILITGSSVYYGGGGGGGVASTANIAGQGGLGGGGAGSKGAVTATNGIPGTGGGGGGSGFSGGTNGIAGNGGSGIVIIRYNTLIPLTSQNSIISTPLITPNIIELPGAITWTIGTNKYFIFNYTIDNSGIGQSKYTINIPSGGLTCDILLVGGGGGGGGTAGSGGGGDVIEINNLILQSGIYTINVGRGGIGGNTNATLGTNGINSSFSGSGIYVLAEGGGGGWALWTATNAGNLPTLSYFTHPITGVSTPTCGGVGGTGGDYNKNNAKSVANSPSGSGGTSDNPVVGGAGGGAAPSTLGNGGNSTTTAGGSGGKGITSSITGTLIEYGGGGGAGSWNLSGLNPAGTATGGGGYQITNGGTFIEAVNGSGGGGSLSRNGGSGVIIMKFTLQSSIITPTILESPGVIKGTIDTDRYIILTYRLDNTGTGQTQYNINVPTDNIICDILMVGGGGAGGKDIGGGGGGGAVLYGTNISIPKTNYVVKVGRGATPGETRGKSTEGFGAIVLGGGSASNTGWDPPNANGNGNTGGSGGGGKGVQAGYSVPSGGRFGISTKGSIMASSIIYYGNLGGSGLVQGASGTKVAGGGGGGAVSNGTDANTTTGRGGDGGDGVEINIIGTSYWWGAGGGGDTEGINNTITGGNGGKGGGGAGGGSQAGVIGQTINGNVGTNGYGVASGKNAGPNTGSGGGGARYTDTVGGNGGSGIIIIRYRNKPSITNVGIGTTNPITELHVYDDKMNNTTVSVQNNYLDPIVITPNNKHTVTETIENNRYYRTLTFTYNVSYPVLADDVNYLFAWYKLDGNLIDSSRFGAVATLPNGAITYTTDTSKFTNLPNYISATFNGTASTTGAYALTPTIYKDVPLSFAFWFMTTGTAYYTIMGYGDKSANNPRIQFDFLNEGGSSYQLKVFTALNNQWTISPIATGLSLNTWYFCVYTLSSTSPVNCVLYINGTQRATGSGNAGQTLSVNKDLTIGASGDGGRGFVGQIADIRIYNKVLSFAEITTLYTVNTPASIVSTINFRIPTPIFVNGGSAVTVQGLYNISVGPTNSSVLKAQGQAVDPLPSTATTTISIKYEYKDTTLSLPKLIDIPGTTTTILGTTDRCISFPYTSETIAGSGQTEYIFSPSETILCDILLVGGGGAGGSAGGSGGGGDVLEFNNIILDAGNYRILVGNGGVYVASNNYTGNVGKNSSITINNNTLTAAGGGGGGAYGYSPAVGWTSSSPSAIPTATFLHPITLVSVTSSGGGGGGANQSTAGATGTGISGNGGRNSDNNGVTGGAGGGAAPPPLGNGGNSTITGSSFTGNGGKGISSYITGTLIEYGGGGAGGRWNDTVTTQGTSSGGGGFMLRNNSGTVWTANFFPGENGRGGGATMSTGGGSGIVIIRYRKTVSSSSIELLRLSNNSVNEIVITGTTSTVIGTDRCISFPYSGSASTMDYTFTTTETLNCDLLIVGGGGGGSAGGGGGGGYLYYTNIYLPSGNNYVVKVGNGGTGATSSTNGNQGANSSFIGGSISYIAYGGGGGGGNTQIAPAHTNGQVGSYGGNGHDNTTIQTYTSTQGNIGGRALATASGSGGGGGGAGRNGENAVLVAGLSSQSTATDYYRGGKGGNGLGNNITNTLVYYAGGGTAGANTNNGTDTIPHTASFGGGGIGALGPNGNGSNGTNGLGGGGGGGDWERTTGTSGGSGIVIMRYRRGANYRIGNFNGDFKVIATTSANNNTDYLRITENGSSIYNATGTPLWSTVSDRRIKENIERASYEMCYNNIDNLELYRFNYISELNNINKDLKQLGYIAQEVNKIFPKSVTSNPYNNNSISISDLLSIDITQINYTLFGSVKRLIELINNKLQRLEKLENILNIDSNSSNIAINSDTSNINIYGNTSNITINNNTNNIVINSNPSNINIYGNTSNISIIDNSISNISIIDNTSINIMIDNNTSNIAIMFNII